LATRANDIQWFSLDALKDICYLEDDWIIERVRCIGGYTSMDVKKAREQFLLERKEVSLGLNFVWPCNPH